MLFKIYGIVLQPFTFTLEASAYHTDKVVKFTGSKGEGSKFLWHTGNLFNLTQYDMQMTTLGLLTYTLK
jgi:hypothetical protein